MFVFVTNIVIYSRKITKLKKKEIYLHGYPSRTFIIEKHVQVKTDTLIYNTLCTIKIYLISFNTTSAHLQRMYHVHHGNQYNVLNN